MTVTVSRDQVAAVPRAPSVEIGIFLRDENDSIRNKTACP